MTYDASARLASITDPVGITSSYTYSPTETTFCAQLTTPYGTSSFNDTLNPNDPSYPDTRSLTLTDPLGYTDFLYFYQGAPHSRHGPPVHRGPPACPPPTTSCITATPTTGTGMPGRHAWPPAAARSAAASRSRRDVTKSFITHFAHMIDQSIPVASDDVESVKPPLEHRTCLTMRGQGRQHL